MRQDEITHGTQIYLSINKRRYVLLVLEHYLHNNDCIINETETAADEINKSNNGKH